MSIKTKKYILTAYTMLALISGLGFAIYRIFLLKKYYDPYNMSFEHGSASALRTFEYILAAVAIVMLTSAFFAKKIKFQLFSERYSTTSIAVCAICGVILAAVGVLVLINYSGEIFDFYSNSRYHRILYLISLILMFLVALYFLSCASTSLKGSRSKACLSLVLPIFCIFYIGASYFNEDYLFYDSNRITCHVAFIAVLLFLLSESNLAIGKNGFAFHFAASLACIVCVSAYILPLLILVSFWEMSFTLSILTDVCAIGILIYAIFSAFNAIQTLEGTSKKEILP